MHLLYLHQYFATPLGKTGTRSYEFARRWVAAGHRVTVLTSTAQLSVDDLALARGGLVKRLNVSGVEVLALSVPYRQTMGFVRRVWAFLWFSALSSWKVLRLRDVDLVYATSTPLTIGIPALVGRWLGGRRYVFEVRDVWPAVPIEMGVLRNPLLIYVCRRLERAIYRNAEAIVTLSPGMTELVRAAAPPGQHIETVPNCCDTDSFRPEVDGNPVRERHGWSRRFVCLHAGAMGLANGLDLILHAAERLRDDPEFLFVLLGDGREKPRLRRECESRHLGNVSIMDGVPKADLPAYIAAADVCLATFADYPILRHNSANKFFDYLSAGKPVLVNSAGWQREVLESAGAGLGCEMGDATGFAARLAELKADPPRRAAMGVRARALATERFSRDLLAAQVLQVLEGSVSRRRQVSA
ncbi:MAG: glycosyltransferase family 4 protein [Planctomycetes bacterium]|nr:glycosyltransferase family 4 protein [Planctomycetota bacterium]